MAASSVTGVGQGSADKKNKGSEHMTLGVEHLIGPRVVDGGSVVMQTGSPSTATVKFGKALDSATGYFVVATPVGATSGIAEKGVATSVVNTTGFVLTADNSVTTTVNWLLFKL